MKKIIPFFFVAACSITLTSCYAFLHADKLIYQGTIGKKMPPIDVQEDSLNVKANYDASF